MIEIENIFKYLQLGFTHVIPLGYDHILFILCLFFLNSKPKTVAIQCAVFTLAHSISMGLTACGVIIPNSNFIELLIALSILYTAIENIFTTDNNPFRLIVVFGFGLIHGMGFAKALQEVGIPKENFIASLMSFNVGVELGQMTIILAAYFCISRHFSHKIWYKQRIVYPLCSAIGCVALYWTIERFLMTS